MRPVLGQTTVATGQVPQVSSTEPMAVDEEHAVVPEHTRSTGSPLHAPRVEVQGLIEPAVLLQPTVTIEPGVQEKVPALRQPHSRVVPPHVAVVHALVIEPVGPVSTVASTPASGVMPRQRRSAS